MNQTPCPKKSFKWLSDRVTCHYLSSSLHSLGTMNKSVISTVTQFVLLGSPGPWKVQIILFSMILLVYILTLSGNMAIICPVLWDNQLTPLCSWPTSPSQRPGMLPTQSLTCWLIFFPKPRPYLSLLASLISASSFPWAQRNASSSVSWLMITTWPLAVHCTIPQSLMDSSVPFSCPSVGLLVSLDIQLLFFLISTTLRWSQYH